MKALKKSLLPLVGLAGFCQAFSASADYIDGLDVSNGQTVTINLNDTAINVGSVWTGGTLNNEGSVTLTDFADILGTLNNSGLLITKDITHNGKTINNPGGHIVMTGYIDMYSTNSSFENNGKVSVIKGVGNSGNVPGPDVPFTYLFRGPIKNNGNFLIDRNNGMNVCPQHGIGTITNSGVFEVARDTLCDFAEYPVSTYTKATYIQTGGETKVNGLLAAHEVQINGGVVSGIGALTNISSQTGALNSPVTLAPGAPFGTLTLTPPISTGNVVCQGCATDIELGNSAANRDQLQVNGNLYLKSWKLNVVLRNFVPAPGSEFTIVSANAVYIVAGAPTYNLPVLPNGRTWTVQNTGTALILRAN